MPFIPIAYKEPITILPLIRTPESVDSYKHCALERHFNQTKQLTAKSWPNIPDLDRML